MTAGSDAGDADSTPPPPRRGDSSEPPRTQPTPVRPTPPPTQPSAPAPRPVTPAPSPASVEAKPDAGELTSDALWSRTLAGVGEKPSALARMESVTLVRLDGAIAYLRPVSAAHASRVRAGVSWYEARFSEAAGRTIRVRLEKPEDDEADASDTPPGMTDAALRREAESNTLVRTAMDLFQARLVRVEEARAPAPPPPAPGGIQPADDSPDEPAHDDGDDD